MRGEGRSWWRAPGGQILFVVMLVLADITAVSLSYLGSYGLRKVLPWLSPLAHGFDLYVRAGAALWLWPLMFSQQRLYPGYWLTSHEELRRIVTGTTLAGLAAVALTFATQTGLMYSRPVLVGGWLLSLLLVPVGRFLARRWATRLGLMGPKAVILGAGDLAADAVRWLKRQHPPPLRPVAAFEIPSLPLATNVAGVPVLGSLEMAPIWAAQHGVPTAIIAIPDVPRSNLAAILDGQSSSFARVLVLSDLLGTSGPDVLAYDLQGVLALELRRNLLSRRNRLAKRLLDLSLLAGGLIASLPLAALIGVAILAETGRPVIFAHTRIGQRGKRFTAWKFRTMIGGAPERIGAAAGTPELREEWASRQKLHADPRITRVGRVLRRTSLDELPQLWNVLRGDMSLVGPRPIVADEIPRYGEAFHVYAQVPPGLTGLWQVSGRSNTTYAERIALDTHYVRSWSIWMDIVILARTAWIVLKGTGAY